MKINGQQVNTNIFILLNVKEMQIKTIMKDCLIIANSSFPFQKQGKD